MLFHSWIYDGQKWKISATAAAFLDHLVEMDETSWLPQRHVIYERVIQKHVIYGFHKYKWFTHSFVAFMSLGSFSQKYSTDNQLVPKILHKQQSTPFIGNSRCVWERNLHSIALCLSYSFEVLSRQFAANSKSNPVVLLETKWHPFYSELPLILSLTWPGVTHLTICSCQTL